MRAVITYFDPFGGESENSAQLAAQLLPQSVDGCDILTVCLPTSYRRAEEHIKALVDTEPDILLMLGQAAGRACPEIERIAINFDMASIADNDGELRCGELIDNDGPDGIFSTLSVDNIASECRKSNIPAGVSNSAGAFVCNHVMYCALLHIKRRGCKTKAAFIHLPATPAQSAEKRIPTMDSRIASNAVCVMLAAALK